MLSGISRRGSACRSMAGARRFTPTRSSPRTFSFISNQHRSRSCFAASRPTTHGCPWACRLLPRSNVKGGIPCTWVLFRSCSADIIVLSRSRHRLDQRVFLAPDAMYAVNEPVPAREGLRWHAVAIWLALAALLITATRADPDLWGHLKFGLDFLNTHALPAI